MLFPFGTQHTYPEQYYTYAVEDVINFRRVVLKEFTFQTTILPKFHFAVRATLRRVHYFLAHQTLEFRHFLELHTLYFAPVCFRSFVLLIMAQFAGVEYTATGCLHMTYILRESYSFSGSVRIDGGVQPLSAEFIKDYNITLIILPIHQQPRILLLLITNNHKVILMRQKSFISPCKQLNTDRLFRHIHRSSAHCKSIELDNQIPKLIGRNKTFFGPAATGNIFMRSHCKYLSFSSSISYKNQLESRFTRQYLGKSMSSHTAENSIDKLRIIKLSPKAANQKHAIIQLTELIDRPYTSNYQIRDSESSLDNQRPLTNVANTRFRPKKNRNNIHKTEKSQDRQQLPDFEGRVYVPRLWKRLKGLKTKHRKIRNQGLGAIVGLRAN